MENYEAEAFLSAGFGGTVHVAINKATGQKVALKKVDRSKENASCLAREILCARNLKHDNIITTHEIKDTGSSVFFVQEYADAGDLYEFIQLEGGVSTEGQLKELFGQVLAAVEYMHSRNYCHRDIKPENVVLFANGEKTTAKVIDFGLSEWGSRVEGRVGTDSYAAPEMNTIRPHESVDGKAADIFSLGVLLHSLIVGRHCWSEASTRDSNYAAFLEAHVDGRPGAVFLCDPEEMGVTAHLTALIDSMLDPEPSKRPTAEQVRLYLAKPWFGDFVKEEAEMFSYHLSTKDSGCSWADEEEEMDFSAVPVPDFSCDVNDVPLNKCDSGLSL